MVQGKFKITAEDLVAGNLLHGKGPSYRAHQLLFGLSLLLLVVTGYLFYREGCRFPDVLTWWAAVSLIYIVITPISWWALAALARRSFRQSERLLVLQEVVCTPDDIKLSSERGMVRIPWGDFHRWAMNDKVLLLYQTDSAFLTIPLRGFAPDVGQQLGAWLQAAGVRRR